jgi:Zn-dependent protease
MLKIPGRIPITVYPFFWLLAALIGWINTLNIAATLVWCVIIFFSVLIHEYGHALTAMSFGQRAQIDLVAMGGLTQRRGPKLKLWQEFIIVLNGPIAGFLLFLAAYHLKYILEAQQASPFWLYVLTVTYSVNFFWTIVNLLPIQPLDGGRLLSIVLEAIFGLKGIKTALFLSFLISGMIGLAFFSFHAFLPGALFLLLTFESYRSWRSSLSLTEQDQNFIIQHLLKEAEKDMAHGHQKESINKLERIREITKAGVVYFTATQYLANLLAEEGRYKEAYEILSPLKKKLDADSLRLLHHLAYRSGDWQAAIDVGNRSHQSYPSYDTALLNAFCHAFLGQARPAVGWLQCAIREGLPNLKEVFDKSEFDPIRGDPIFQGIKKQYSP